VVVVCVECIGGILRRCSFLWNEMIVNDWLRLALIRPLWPLTFQVLAGDRAERASRPLAPKGSPVPRSHLRYAVLMPQGAIAGRP
jgi:hypothetical protein